MQVLEMNGSAARRVVSAPADVRLRWRMGPEARGLVLISAALTAFGLAVLIAAMLPAGGLEICARANWSKVQANPPVK